MSILGAFVTYCIMVVNPANLQFPSLYEVQEFHEVLMGEFQVVKVNGNKVCQYFSCTFSWQIDEKCYNL